MPTTTRSPSTTCTEAMSSCLLGQVVLRSSVWTSRRYGPILPKAPEPVGRGRATATCFGFSFFGLIVALLFSVTFVAIAAVLFPRRPLLETRRDGRIRWRRGCSCLGGGAGGRSSAS